MAESEHASASTLDETWDVDMNVSSTFDSGVSTLKITDDGTTDPLRWPKLLGTATKPNPLDDWDQLYNLNSQCVLRNDCRKLAKALENKRSVPELESFLTLYCKRRNLDYTKDSGWVGILEKIFQFGLPVSQEFNVFFALTTKYIPRDIKKGSQIYDLFRLILQYHDPELSNHLDSLKVATYDYANDWFGTLLGSHMNTNACYELWDIYIDKGDPFLIFHLSLVFIINAREKLLEIKNNNREAALEFLSNLSAELNAEDVSDFVQLAVHYSERTPECIRKEFHYLLFGANFDEEAGQIQVSKMLCLPVPAVDLTATEFLLSTTTKVNFFVIDARSNKAFDHGHFPSSFNLDCSSFVDEPEKFEIALNSLDNYKINRRADDHILFMGYGDDNEDQYMHMVISQFIRKSRPHVAFVQGGYKKLHDCASEQKRWDVLSMHFPDQCDYCTHGKQPAVGWNFMSRVKNVVASTSSKMKEKVEEVVAPIMSIKESQSADNIRHADPRERHGKRYRQQSVFTLDDGSDGDSEFSNVKDEKPKQEILLSAEFTETFECQEVFREETVGAHLALTRTHIHVLHDVPGKKGYVTTEARHALSTVMSVTSRKTLPELLTFKFGYEHNGEPNISAVHRFIIPKAGECAKAVKTAIFALRPISDLDDAAEI
ncbi:unnamed protein product [Caenorhabditis auriculariae]|uniref:TBC1 domain family member 23 n=1 Tax=Caenorhabditis auriculariae TaxID=2777116 RepID=A0A8S1HBN6_9PELO|nr:unnamed protein product [Caenorhabditis auriculariae]